MTHEPTFSERYEVYRQECILDKTAGGQFARSCLSPPSKFFWSMFRKLSHWKKYTLVPCTDYEKEQYDQFTPEQRAEFALHMDNALKCYQHSPAFQKWEVGHPEDRDETWRLYREHQAARKAEDAAEEAEKAAREARIEQWRQEYEARRKAA
jgi:hypothetical protein